MTVAGSDHGVLQHTTMTKISGAGGGWLRIISMTDMAGLSYWWRRMERQAADDQKTKLDIKEQRFGAQRISCFLMSGKTSTSKTL